MNRRHRYQHGGAALGVFVGCIIGMLPLVFMDAKTVETKKYAAIAGKE